MSAGIRHKARVAAMQSLCTLIIRNQVLTDDVEKSIQTVEGEYFPQSKENEFFRSLVFGVIKNRTAIDDVLQKHAPRWKVKDLASIDRSVLEIGIYEMMYTTTPTPIVINEAVEVAKEFGEDNSSKFVNGVLSKVSKEEQILEKEEDTQDLEKKEKPEKSENSE